MSQHSDELIEHDPEKLERCAEAMYRAMQFDCGGTLRVRHRRWARAVLDEAAKPAPGGPKMREVKVIIDHRSPDHVPRIKFQRLGESIPLGIHICTVRIPEPTVPEVPARVDGEGE